MTLMLVGVNGGVLLQTLPQPDAAVVEASVAESATVASLVKARVKRAKLSLDKLASLGISLPLDIERGNRRTELLRGRHT